MSDEKIVIEIIDSIDTGKVIDTITRKIIQRKGYQCIAYKGYYRRLNGGIRNTYCCYMDKIFCYGKA